MNIVIITQWYPPEHAPIGYMYKEIAVALIEKGHDVTIVTGFPNHPTGKLHDGYVKKWRSVEYQSGIKIIRLYLYTHENPNSIHRILNFLSFTFTSTFEIIFRQKPNLIFSVLQPLSIGLTLPIVAKLKKSKLIFNIQDLHPKVPVELGLIKNKYLISILEKIESYAYKKSSALVVISNNFKQHCAQQGADCKNISVIPNWIDLNEIVPVPRDNYMRKQFSLEVDDFVILFAGTIGFVAGASVLVKAATLLSEEYPNIKFLFVGAGSDLNHIKTLSSSLLLSNIHYHDFQNREDLSFVQGLADIAMVTLLPGKGAASIPSKVLGYMSAARPVIAAVDSCSETASIINTSVCGLVVQPNQALAIKNAILYLYNDAELRDRFGQNGRTYLINNLSKEKALAQYVSFFECL